MPESPRERDLRRLFRRLAGGDRGSVGELYELMGPQLFHHAISVTRRRADAEDVVHSVFGKLLSLGSRALTIYRPRSYLHRMVHNAAHDRLRERSRVADVGAFDRLFAAPSGDDGTFEQLSVQEALGRLKPTQREIVMLHAITGMTFREIGRALSIPSATAASRYRLALEKMKAILDGESTHED